MSKKPSRQWRVLIHFEQTKVTFLVHVPTEEQQRGYHNDQLYTPDKYSFASYHLQLFTEAANGDEAKAKARQLLLAYVQEPAAQDAGGGGGERQT